MRSRGVTAIWLLVTAVVLVGLGAFLSQQNWEKADQIASVLSLLFNVVGVSAALVGVVLGWLAWRRKQLGGGSRDAGSARSDPSSGSSSVGSVTAGRDAYVAGHDQHFGTRPEVPEQEEDPTGEGR